MFDDLHDPDPPHPGCAQFLAVTARAKRLRARRYLLAGTACAVVLGLGAGAVALTAGDGPGEIAPATAPTAPPTDPTTASSTSPSTAPTEPSAAVTDPTVAPTEPASVCVVPDLGLMVVVDGDLRRVLPDGSSEPVATADAVGGEIVRAFEASDGTIWVEVARRGRNRLIGTIMEDLRLNEISSGEVRLAAVGELRGIPVAAILDNSNEPYSDSSGSVNLLDGNGDTQLSIGPVNSPVSGVFTVGVGDDIVALAKSADVSEAFEYYGADGTKVVRFDPTGSDTPDPSDDKYALPPFFISPILSPDGSELAWLEGPDGDVSAGGERVGQWELVVGGSDTGVERLRLRIGVTDDQLISSDFDGRWFVANFGRADPGIEPEPSRSVIIDTAASRPGVSGMCDGFTGVSISRSGP